MINELNSSKHKQTGKSFGFWNKSKKFCLSSFIVLPRPLLIYNKTLTRLISLTCLTNSCHDPYVSDYKQYFEPYIFSSPLKGFF